MTCTRPMPAYRGKDGSVTFVRRDSTGVNSLTLACGQCPGCLLDRSQAWALRCVHEAQMFKESGKGSSFVTLTYNRRGLPDGMSLHLPDLQKFFKRLRHEFSFRYYAAGEYGSDNRRPHYHALLFGVDFREDRIPIGTNEFGDRRYISPTLSRVWGLGNAELGSLSWRSAAYCAGYIIDKAGAKEDDEKYFRKSGEIGWYVDREFAVMSRRPGIGRSWYEKYGKDVFPSDFLTVDGRKRRVPKFYDRLLERASVSELQAVKEARVVRARKSQANVTPERLAAKEYILISNKNRKVL